MALAEKLLADGIQPALPRVVDHHTYVFLGDGCLMEGISHEACSLAGTLQLGKLICFYDDNGISIDGEVHGWFTDDTPKRFEAYGWHVVPNVDGHDAAAIEQAIQAAKAEKTRPSLICCKTDHRLGLAEQAGHRGHARRAARRRRDRRNAREARLDRGAVRDPGRHPRRLGRASQGRRGRAGLERALRGVPRGAP